MKIIRIFVIFFTGTPKYSVQIRTGTTLSIDEKVALLKHQISQQIQDNVKTFPIDTQDVSASYEYEDLENKPITPIMDFDERKKHGMYKLRPLKTTTDKELVRLKSKDDKNSKNITELETSITEKKIEADISSKENEKPLHVNDFLTVSTKKPKHKRKHKKKRTIRNKMAPKSADNSFHRRLFIGNLEKYCVKETIHCTDLITPVLTGHKTNVTVWKELNHTDHVVVRLVQLLGENTADLTQEEIYSILYQISNLQIRLFQWDVQAIKLLLNVITKEVVRRHSFKTIKEGLKRTLDDWHLDYSNVTNLLQQARLFRPPCIRLNNYEGSTQSSKTIRFTTPKKPKCPVGKIKKNGDCELF